MNIYIYIYIYTYTYIDNVMQSVTCMPGVLSPGVVYLGCSLYANPGYSSPKETFCTFNPAYRLPGPSGAVRPRPRIAREIN